MAVGFPGVPLVERFLLADVHADLDRPRDAAVHVDARHPASRRVPAARRRSLAADGTGAAGIRRRATAGQDRRIPRCPPARRGGRIDPHRGVDVLLPDPAPSCRYLPARTRAARRRRRTHPQPARWSGHEHRDRRRREPGLEARARHQRPRRRQPARHLRGRATPDRQGRAGVDQRAHRAGRRSWTDRPVRARPHRGAPAEPRLDAAVDRDEGVAAAGLLPERPAWRGRWRRLPGLRPGDRVPDREGTVRRARTRVGAARPGADSPTSHANGWATSSPSAAMATRCWSAPTGTWRGAAPIRPVCGRGSTSALGRPAGVPAR